MFKNDNGNKINEKDKKYSKDIDDLENLYNLLNKKQKDEYEKKLCNIEYQNIWENIGDICFKKESPNKSENVESSKFKIDVTKNKYLENEKVNLSAKDDMSFETIFKLIRQQEITNFVNSYDNDYDTYLSDEEEEPPVIKTLINEIQKLEKILNGEKKTEKSLSKKKIQLYLFLIYMILKYYPFFVPKRSYLEKYYLQLKKYKDWPDQIGAQGKKLYSLFIDELYLPGITIFKEIREKYFLDLVDPNKFMLIRDDFLRYYFIFDDRIGSSTYKFLKEEVSEEKWSIIAKDLFSPASNIINFKEIKTKADAKTLKIFNHLTIMHLIIFFSQQVLSHNEKISSNVYQRLCEQYFKTIPDFINKEGNFDLQGKAKQDDKKDNFNSIYDKNISRNTLNKSLLNSFFNILDVGLKTDYYKDFLPMLKEIEKKIMSSINNQEGSNVPDILNLREFLIPKIEIRNPKNLSLIYLYQCNYINIEEKYFPHLNKTIDYKNYDINPEDQQRVDQFNCIVNIKKNIIEKYLKMRIIIHEEQLINFINTLLNDVDELQDKLEEKEYNEKRLLKEQMEKEKEQKEKNLKQENEKIFKKKRDENQIEKEKKKKEDEEKIKRMHYYELKKLLESNPNNIEEVQMLVKKKEANALPDVENFLNSITLYILPNESKDQHLSNYICRNNFIYQYIFSKKNGMDYNAINKLLKENLSIYLEEANNYFELDVYKIILTPTKDKEDFIINYFYSYVEIEIMDEDSQVSITYLNNTDNPENEKSIRHASDIKKVYIMNLMFKEKDKKDKLSGAKYILNENSGFLTVFCMKNDINEITNINYYGKLLFHQTNSEIFNCDEIKITGKLKIDGIPNIVENSFQEIIVGHAYYNLENQEKRVKLKIAVF